MMRVEPKQNPSSAAAKRPLQRAHATRPARGAMRLGGNRTILRSGAQLG